LISRRFQKRDSHDFTDSRDTLSRRFYLSFRKARHSPETGRDSQETIGLKDESKHGTESEEFSPQAVDYWRY
jgi:hypothetical protein